MNKTAYIKKEKGKYCVKSEKNPDWSGGCYDSKKRAEERLKQVEMFKNMDDANDVLYVSEEDAAADFIPDDQRNIGNQGYIGGDGTGGSYSLFSVPEARVAGLVERLVKIADKLDKKQEFDLADILDVIVKALVDGDEDDARDAIDMLAGANGRLGTGVVDNQNAGMFQGFSDAYMYTGYGDLEGPSPVPSAPGRV